MKVEFKMAAGKTEGQNERRDRSQRKLSSPSGPAREKRKPRGAIFHGDDPTLAKLAEEELYTFGR